MKRENWLEVGLLAVVITMLGAAGLAIAGRTSGSLQRSQRHGLPPPDPGTVSHRSHQNVASSAAR